jgi:guanylate kinase
MRIIRFLVVMGVSGGGKTSVVKAYAEEQDKFLTTFECSPEI